MNDNVQPMSAVDDQAKVTPVSAQPDQTTPTKPVVEEPQLGEETPATTEELLDEGEDSEESFETPEDVANPDAPAA